jgi:phosphoacetylglucosamine mutase
MSFLSYDGDADRTVYYRVERNSEDADLFEGDKLGALYALFCQKTLTKIVELQRKVSSAVTLQEDFTKWSIGAALTAYANGSAQKYYKDDLKVVLKIEPTGVKYLHVAAEHFDIGIYFESNGHGTVVFHPEKLAELEHAIATVQQVQGKTDEEKKDILSLLQHLKLLYYFLIEANQGVGDAISNFLQIETALAALKMNAADWKALYKDLVNANTKIVVKNRFAVKVNYDQSKVTEPADIQPKIEEICSKYEMGRAFIRPSGTEDICRVYVEATKLEDLKAIQQQINEYVLAHKEVN